MYIASYAYVCIYGGLPGYPVSACVCLCVFLILGIYGSATHRILCGILVRCQLFLPLYGTVFTGKDVVALPVPDLLHSCIN